MEHKNYYGRSVSEEILANKDKERFDWFENDEEDVEFNSWLGSDDNDEWGNLNSINLFKNHKESVLTFENIIVFLLGIAVGLGVSIVLNILSKVF